MAKKLYNWVTFNYNGNLRGFNSGFAKKEANKFMAKDIEDGYIVMAIDSLGVLPDYMLNAWYIKTSVNNDFETITDIVKRGKEVDIQK